MNTEEARVKTGIQQGRGHGDERGVKPVCDRDLPRRSVEILRDLGLSTEKIVAYHRRRRTFSAQDLVAGLGPDVEPFPGRLYAAR
jgi:hypothetical protein